MESSGCIHLGEWVKQGVYVSARVFYDGGETGGRSELVHKAACVAVLVCYPEGRSDILTDGTWLVPTLYSCLLRAKKLI